MNITRMAIEKNRVTAVAILLIILAGLSTYFKMPRSQWPPFTIRMATVMTYFPGASPARMEMLVTDKLEKAIQEMPEIKNLTSTSRNGFSVVFVEVKASYNDLQPIWDKLRRKVDRVRGDLPENIIGPLVDDEFGDVFGTIITIIGEGFTYRELKDIADQVRDELLLIEEVAKVEILGAQEERVFIEYNNAKLAELGLSAVQLKNIIEARNIIIPGGSILVGDERLVVEPSGNFETIEELKRTVINLPGRPEVMYLENLAEIKREYIDPASSKVRSSGVPCLGLAISLREDGNILTLGDKVKTEIERLHAVFPYGIEFDTVAFEPLMVEKGIHDFVGNLTQAVILVLLVMLVGLGFRTGFLVASLIPTTIMMTFLLMDYFGIRLHRISLASLIIALGMLVDNAIVMSESIMVRLREGLGPVDAAVDSAGELKVPLLTASLTTAAAFLPIFLAESDVGEYCSSIFKVVTIALMSSWILALTMTPLLCAKYLRAKPVKGEGVYNSGFYIKYRGFLMGLLRKRTLTLFSVVVIFIGVMSLMRFVPKIFFPPDDTPVMKFQMDMPVGTSIERTEEVVGLIEDYIQEDLLTGDGRKEGIVNWSSYIGQGAPRFVLSFTPEMASPFHADMILNITSYEAHYELIEKVSNFCTDHFPDLEFRVTPMENGPPVGRPIQYRISGKEMDEIFAIVDKVKSRLAEIPGVRGIGDDWGIRSKKLVVQVDQPRARRAGITSQDVAISLQTQLSGFQTTEYREEDEIIPVTMRSVAAERDDIGKLESMNVYAQMTGRAIPLKQLADLDLVWEPSSIFRRNRLKTVTVQADLAQGVTATEVNTAMLSWLDEEQQNWPVGYKYMLGGEAEGSEESQKAIGAKLPVAGFIILILLIIQFNSLRKALIILSTIPLGLVGVVLGLLILNQPFGFMTLLGIVSLAGIVINNAIVLLDRIKIEIEENGLSPQRAVIESAQRRLRPILLTTTTTVGGMIPLYLGGGLMFQPMAVTIMFGLMGSTVLTLGVLPVLYSFLFRVNFNKFEY